MPTLRQLIDGAKQIFDATVAEHGGFGAPEKQFKAQTEAKMPNVHDLDAGYEVRELRTGYRGAVRGQYVTKTTTSSNDPGIVMTPVNGTATNFPTLNAMAEEYQRGYKVGYGDGVSAESARAKKQRESNKQRVDIIKKERDVSFEE